MRVKSAGPVLVILSCVQAFAFAGDERSASLGELRKEVKELQKVIARFSSRLEAMERRLAQLEGLASASAPARGRAVPESIDRAMLLEERMSPARQLRMQEGDLRRSERIEWLPLKLESDSFRLDPDLRRIPSVPLPAPDGR